MTHTTGFGAAIAGPDACALRAQAAEHGTPLLLLDCDRIRDQYRALAAALPTVALHYAIKALPHPAAIEQLAALGSGFDVATRGELELLRDANINAERVIHTHPIKSPADIDAALAFGCRRFVIDNPAELAKFERVADRVELLLRVGFRSGNAQVDLAKKFGCAVADVLPLLAQARERGLAIVGLSFHVGSQCPSGIDHARAIAASIALIRHAERAGLVRFKLLDIGGGFPVSYVDAAPAIDAFCAPIRRALDDVPLHIKVIAEPGRYLVAPAMTAVASVVGKAERDGHAWYYLDDGIYGSYGSMLFEGATYPLSALTASPATAAARQPCVLAGPTCDSVDIIAEAIELPPLDIGDLIVGRMMGAYTTACASEFNSIPKPRVVVVNQAVAPRPRLAVIPHAA